jgi:hypothetical protein
MEALPGRAKWACAPFSHAPSPEAKAVQEALLRDFIFEALAPVERDAGAARLCLESDDDVGTRYHLKRSIEHIKAAAATFRELEELTRTASVVTP